MINQLEVISVSFLLFLSSLLGVSHLPEKPDPNWIVSTPWQKKNNGFFLKAESLSIPDLCRKHRSSFIEFPVVIHGAHQIFLDGVLVKKFGQTNFESLRSFYGAPVLSCSRFGNEQKITWEIYSYSNYFARIKHFPRISNAKPFYNIFGETFQMVAGGTLLLLSLFTLVIFLGKVERRLTIFLAASNFFMAGYFINTVSDYFGFSFSMLSAHKLADFFLWIGILCLFWGYHIMGAIPKIGIKILIAHLCVALPIIAIGTNGDVVQFGTTLPFACTLGILFWASYRIVRAQVATNSFKRTKLLQLLSFNTFAFAGVNDIGLVTGFFDSVALLPLGIVILPEENGLGFMHIYQSYFRSQPVICS